MNKQVRLELDSDMQDGGMPVGEIEGCLNHWSNKYIILKKSFDRLKHWKEAKTAYGYGKQGIVLKGGNGRILSVHKDGEMFVVSEECDATIQTRYKQAELLELISELYQWVLKQ